MPGIGKVLEAIVRLDQVLEPLGSVYFGFRCEFRF
jgi:hypothetical protein